MKILLINIYDNVSQYDTHCNDTMTLLNSKQINTYKHNTQYEI
jgi:hypothetical protein